MPEAAADSLAKEENAKQFRFEKLAEIFSYITLLGALLVGFLPNKYSVDPKSLYLFIFTTALVVFIWFRFIPAKYSGRRKNFLYAVLTLLPITVGAHFTGGILSTTVFLYYLVSMWVAATMGAIEIAVVAGLAAFYIGLEAVLGVSDPSLGLRSLSLGFLRIWGLLLTSSFGWIIFQEEGTARSRQEQARLEKAKAIDKIKNEFVYIISSKLREPIASLQQYLRTARNIDKDLSQDSKELLAKTEENSGRLEALVNDLSDLSKIETGKLRLELKDVDLAQVIGATLSDFTLPAHEKNIRLIYEPFEQEVKVEADSGRLHEIVANLVDNAIKYSEKNREVRVEIELSDNFAVTKISDQGFGIPNEASNHLFEKFYRVERTDVVQPKGTGLGLFITKQLVERQGGKIWFDSGKEAGTVFYFSLPLSKK